jgi:hypothetical protein
MGGSWFYAGEKDDFGRSANKCFQNGAQPLISAAKDQQVSQE